MGCLSSRIIAYTDGSANVKTRMGGYGVYIEAYESDVKVFETEISAGESDTTISRMEMKALIKAMELCVDLDYCDNEIVIISDSQFVINSINEKWIEKWIEKGLEKRPNSDLWEVFLALRPKLSNVIFTHTRGHGKGSEQYKNGNDRADKLASYKNF